MSEKITESTVVGELIIRNPGMRPILERLGIDYCCGGRHTLKEAAAEKGVSLKEVLDGLDHALVKTSAAGRDYRDWSSASLPELIAHILNRHHTFMKEQLPRLAAILSRVLVAHGARHGEELRALQELYAAMDTALTHHLFTEEEVVFPLILKVAGGAGRNANEVEALRPHIEHLEEEHRAAGRELQRMREVTSNYRLPEDACASFRALYEGLTAMEVDLHEHIHLENNILFPRALGVGGCR